MEDTIRLLITISVVTAALLALIVLAVLIHYLRAKVMANHLLKRGTRGRNFVYELLRTSFPAGRIFKNARIPYRLSDGTKAFAPCDLILVDRGGVFVIRVKSLSGSVDNTDSQVWTVRNKKGVAEFPNPVEQNRNGTKALNALLKREKILNVPLHNLVVFTGRRVRFRMCTDRVMTAEHLLDAIRDLNRNKFLSAGEMATTVNLLRRIRPRPQNQPQNGSDTPEA